MVLISNFSDNHLLQLFQDSIGVGMTFTPSSCKGSVTTKKYSGMSVVELLEGLMMPLICAPQACGKS
jgi:hypothetical protein